MLLATVLSNMWPARRSRCCTCIQMRCSAVAHSAKASDGLASLCQSFLPLIASAIVHAAVWLSPYQLMHPALLCLKA